MQNSLEYEFLESSELDLWVYLTNLYQMIALGNNSKST